MTLTPEIRQFIKEHLDDDPDRLLFQKKNYTDKRVERAVEQIYTRKRIKDKVPSWYANPDIFFPSELATEQCSSEITASYKAQLCKGETLCDLTGGMGVDSYFFSLHAKGVTYVEQNEAYCDAARSNFMALGATNIRVVHGEATRLAACLAADTYYIDPSRRTQDNKRIFALTDYEPNVLEIKDFALQNGQRLIVKISPMADITAVLHLLPETTAVHVLSVKNECKELLFVLDKNGTGDTLRIHAVNFVGEDQQLFTFTLEEEKEASATFTDVIQKYLYEPNSAVLKSGAFKLIAQRYNLAKLHPHSHLYTSDSLVVEFPGRVFQVEHTHEFTSKFLKQIARTLPKANITTRNFKLSVNEIRTRSKIKEGGDIYLFATTLNNQKPVMIRCRKAEK